MPEIILDNLVFDLQSHGGITSVWEPILKGAAASDLRLGFVQSAGHQEILARLGAAGVPLTLEKGAVLRRRFAKVAVPKTCRVFHSSYFRIAAPRGVKNIVTVHDCIAEQFDKGPRRLLHIAQKKRALRGANTVVTVSQNTRNDLLKFYPWLDPGKITVIHNGVNLDYFKPAEKPKRKVLLYVGGRNIHKNFALALRLLASDAAKGFTLEVCGGGSFSASEQALIAELGLKKRVHALGAVPLAALREAYQSAYALVYPSFYEGFGIPPIEAMACGCPVLASNRSSLPEVVGDAALTFDPESLHSAEQALAKLVDRSERERLIERGYARANALSQTTMVARYLALYQSLLAAPQ